MKMTKRLLNTVVIGSLFLMMGCSSTPSIDAVEKDSAEAVEQLLTEDNNEELTIRMDRYFLTEQVDDLTYKGTLKATAFQKTLKWDERIKNFVDTPDSVKFYRTVTIKFRDKKYDYYSIAIEDDE